MGFTEDLQELVSTVFGPISPSHAITNEAVQQGEDRLRVGLPSVLHSYYHVTGNHPQVSEGMNHLLRPDALWLANGGVVFEEENQQFYYSGILLNDLRQDDPPVMQGNRNEDKWYLEANRLSDYLLCIICWQACNVLPAARLMLPQERLNEMKRAFRWVSFGVDPKDDTIGLWGEGVSAAAFTKSGDVYLAARTEELLEALQARWHLTPRERAGGTPLLAGALSDKNPRPA